MFSRTFQVLLATKLLRLDKSRFVITVEVVFKKINTGLIYIAMYGGNLSHEQYLKGVDQTDTEEREGQNKNEKKKKRKGRVTNMEGFFYKMEVRNPLPTMVFSQSINFGFKRVKTPIL